MSLLDYLGPRKRPKVAAKPAGIQQEWRPNQWLTLANSDGQRRRIFGYKGGQSILEPRWFGYTVDELKTAPCVHCGQVGVFSADDPDFQKPHACPGEWDGNRLPCAVGHECKGVPSMCWHGTPMYVGISWSQLDP